MSSVPVARADDPDDPLTALMMGGTAMPTPSEYWQDTIVTDYIDTATGDSYTPLVVPTPSRRPARHCRTASPNYRLR